MVRPLRRVGVSAFWRERKPLHCTSCVGFVRFQRDKCVYMTYFPLFLFHREFPLTARAGMTEAHPLMSMRLSTALQTFPLFFIAQMPYGFEDIFERSRSMKNKVRWKPGGRSRASAGTWRYRRVSRKKVRKENRRSHKGGMAA